jgi:hypothetical protein
MFWSNPYDCSSLQPNQHSPQPALWVSSAKRVLFPHLCHLQETWQRMVQKHAKTTRAVIVHHKHVMEKNGKRVFKHTLGRAITFANVRPSLHIGYFLPHEYL